jgi:hypothetical protein
VGVAPGTRLWAVKIFDSQGNGSETSLLQGLNLVLSHAGEIEAVLLPFGGDVSIPGLQTLIQALVAQGVVVVAAAGDGPIDASNVFPASYPEVIAVSAMADCDGQSGGTGGFCLNSGCFLSDDDTLACFSNFGPAVDLAAPGVNILSTYPGGTGTFNGTGFAAAHVAGAVALEVAANGRPIDAQGVAALSQKLITAGEVQSQWGPLNTQDPDFPDNLEPLVDAGPACTQDPDCDDGDACNGAETCNVTTGQCQTGTPVTCTAQDTCHEDGTCDPFTGLCSNPIIPAPTDPNCHQGVVVATDGYLGQLFLVDLDSGERRLISDFGDPAQGTLLGYPTGIAVETTGNILVVDNSPSDEVPAPAPGIVGAIFRVDPTDGTRFLVTEWNQPPGMGSGGPYRIALESADSAVVTTTGGGSPPSNPAGSLLRIPLNVGPLTTSTTLVDFGDPNGGTVGSCNIYDVAIRGSGQYLVSDVGGCSQPENGIFQVSCDSASPPNCVRTLSTDVGVVGPFGLGLDPVHQLIYAADPFGEDGNRGAIYKVDMNQPTPWHFALFSDFANGNQGVAYDNYAFVVDAKFDPAGGIWALNQTSNLDPCGELLRIDPTSGFRTLVSSFSSPQGDTGCSPVNFAVYSQCTPSTEVCDGVDNDCDGVVDENFVSTPTSCGVGACAATGATSCVGGVVTDSCTPGTPAANDATCNGIDDDCDGAVDENFVSTPTSCGVGACASTGATACVGGTVTDSCTPGTPASNDSLCNGIDDDCDGPVDEEFVSTPTSCGIGTCASTGTTSCTGGAVIDSCTPGKPSGEVCDGLDNDCNGTVDDGNAATCSDGNVCTSNDSCLNGSCVGNAVPNCCSVDSDCNDFNLCTKDVCKKMKGSLTGSCTNACVNSKTNPSCKKVMGNCPVIPE